MEKICAKCRYFNKSILSPPCIVCKKHDRWEASSPRDWLEDWLSSFNTESATTCFEAMQKLKQRVKEMQESEEEE